MLTISSIELNAWIAALLWPLSRVLGLVAAAPLFGNTAIPRSGKITLGVLLTMIVAPAVPPLPATDPMSLAGLLIVAKEMIVGLAMGFAMRIVFAAVEMAGEVASMTMGLGFAVVFDPQTQGRSSAISQFLALVATMVFLAVNGHLVLLEALTESFYTLPVGAVTLTGAAPWELARWGGQIFAFGLQLSLPIVAALLVTNVALGILTRAAPQLNIFGIGFPVSLGVGLLVISLALPYLNAPLQHLINQGIETARRVARSALVQTTPPPAPTLPGTRPAP